MDKFLWGLALIVGFVVIAGFVEAWAKRRRKVPLSSHQPERSALENDKEKPLGLEATDLKALRKTLRFNDRLAGQSGADGATFAGIKPHDRPNPAGTRRSR